MLVTTTFTVPAAWAGVVAAIDVLLTTRTPVAAVLPRLTVNPDRKPVPVMVTEVPPSAVPVLGVVEVTAGAGLPVACPRKRKVAICMTQSSAPPFVAVAV